MGMNNYFDKKEADCWQKLQQWVSTSTDFRDLTPMPRGWRHDAEAVYNGTTWQIECKDRGWGALSAFTFPTVFIEPEKREYLLNDVENPVFINFFGEDVVVFDREALSGNLRLSEVSIYDKGLRKRMKVKRYELPLNKGKKYLSRCRGER